MFKVIIPFPNNETIAKMKAEENSFLQRFKGTTIKYKDYAIEIECSHEHYHQIVEFTRDI